MLVLPEAGLGPWFWIWVVLFPGLELYRALALRELRRNGSETWVRNRPVRDSVLAACATPPLILPLAFYDDVSLGEAVLAGLACGVIVLVPSLVGAGWNRRAPAVER